MFCVVGSRVSKEMRKNNQVVSVTAAPIIPLGSALIWIEQDNSFPFINLKIIIISFDKITQIPTLSGVFGSHKKD